MGTGDQSGTWGTTTNTNLGTAIEEAITGSANVAFSSADVTLTLTNTNTSQAARNLRLRLTGTSGGARTLTVPNIEKFYIIANELADDVTVENSTGTTYTVPAGTTGQVFSTGTGVKAAMNFFEGAVLSSAAVILGGAIDATPIGAISASTGAFTTLSASGTLTASAALNASATLTSSGTLAVTGGLTLDGAAGTSGQVLVSAGSGNTPTWGNAFIAGMIMMWSGTIATIPSGWVLCDGTNSTPDLRNRFIIGAYSDDSGVAKTTITGTATQTGGSKDSIVVSHTHTGTTDNFDLSASLVSDALADAGVQWLSDWFTTATGRFTLTNFRPTSNVANGGLTQNFAKGLSFDGNHTHAFTTASSGSSGTDANLVPYFALAFIMKT